MSNTPPATEHPVRGFLTAEEFEAAKNAGYGMAQHYKNLNEKRRKEAKKQRGKRK